VLNIAAARRSTLRAVHLAIGQAGWRLISIDERNDCEPPGRALAKL
jgi:hypothetical protein